MADKDKSICGELIKINGVECAAILARTGGVLDIAGPLDRITVAPIVALAGVGGRITTKIGCGELSEITVKAGNGAFILMPEGDRVVFIKTKAFSNPSVVLEEVKKKLTVLV
jgi:predicted regulator of Ras-like GTPase activity (Roadblock/LC7/MglB family)